MTIPHIQDKKTNSRRANRYSTEPKGRLMFHKGTGKGPERDRKGTGKEPESNQ